MTKRSVDDLYGGRHPPHGQVRDGSHRRVESEPPMETASARDTAFNKNTNQAPENRHDPGYGNDHANDWGEGAAKGRHRQAVVRFGGMAGERQKHRQVHPASEDSNASRRSRRTKSKCGMEVRAMAEDFYSAQRASEQMPSKWSWLAVRLITRSSAKWKPLRGVGRSPKDC